ncbi:putative pectin lyase precursor [Mycena albidolilacea]|uniref:pectin lyase n=1 Tax=Mycena albidolilacea TaxID=1033008 RepID=A0AAD6ZVM7_9AGAR|nr:putative pectin lyase precursor [Mycena albidolilacea]
MPAFFIPVLTIALVLSSALPGVTAIGSAFGYGNKATGGGAATPVTPTSQAQLVTWLTDSTPRVILLTTMMDFTTFFGTSTAEVCSPWSCSPNPQQMINTANNFCAEYPGKTNAHIQGTTNSFYLFVGSNKTLLGKGSNAGLNGIGLRLTNGVSNIIIQNIRITNLNARYVWGGDASDQQSKSTMPPTFARIDHNYFNRIGRQFIVTGFGAANGITVSNNYFDGHADFSTGCDGHHYWVGLFAGNGDRMTFANNYIFFTAGRGPHTGGTTGFTLRYHIVNNYYESISGHALDISLGSWALAEGNYFDGVTTPVLADTGTLYFPQSSSEASACTAKLGRACQANVMSGSGAVATNEGNVWGALAGDAVVSTYKVMTAAAAKSFVLANAGVGKIN